MLRRKTTILNCAAASLAAVVFALLGGGVAQADFTFGPPINVNTAIPILDDGNLDTPECFSYDGLEMYISSSRLGGSGDYDLWVFRRTSVDENWGPPENLGAANSSSMDAMASISSDGLELYFNSNQPGGYGSSDLYVTRRTTRTSPWGPAENLGPKINSAQLDGFPWVSPDGLELYFHSLRPGGYGGYDIYVSTRATRNDSWGDAANVGPVVNGPYNDCSPCLSPDGLLLFLQDFGTPRPGGYGGSDVWMARRAGRLAPWGPPANAGPTVNGPAPEVAPRISSDGTALYFGRQSDGTCWQAPIIPVLDFNGDGRVDAADMALLEADWGKSESVCDIGPFAWGDGVVDERDLRILMESLMTPAADASDILCDAILTWILPSLAESCDVYLGTSREVVTGASRDDPCGVLVSEGQVETTYDPAGLLEYNRTYYWRVDAIDVVVGSLEPLVYKGPVLSFTTEPYARPIQSITATASSRQRGMGPETTVNGSGLDQNDAHSTKPDDMWLSQAPAPQWIQYEFDNIYTLHELWVWNSNQAVEPLLGFGAKTVKIEYSTDGTTWTALADVPEFARAPGRPGYVHNTTVSFGGVSAKYVKLTIGKPWGSGPSTGLSEVRFFYIPDRSAAPQ